MPKKTQKTLPKIDKKVLGMIDSRATMDDELILKRQRNATMKTFFGTDQMSAVAYYVSDLVAKGFNEKQICECVNSKYELKWNLRAVKVCLSLLRKVWRNETACLMEDHIARELASLKVQEKEAWEAWEFSKKGISKKKTRTEKKDGDSAIEGSYNITEVIQEDDTTAGNPKYLERIMDIGKERRRLLGLYAPEKKSDKTNDLTAIQFNIVGGENAACAVNDLMGSLLNKKQPELKQSVQDVEIVNEVPIQNTENDFDIENLFDELINED